MWSDYMWAAALMTPVIIITGVPLCFLAVKMWRIASEIKKNWDDAMRHISK